MNVLLSIKPKFVEGIMNGNKKYEFRKSIFRHREDVELVYIYSTSPVKKVVGWFTIETIVEDHPDSLWDSFKDHAGIEEQEFFEYFGERENGFAIGVDEVNTFEDHLDPREANPDFAPPQSFCYVNQEFGAPAP